MESLGPVATELYFLQHIPAQDWQLLWKLWVEGCMFSLVLFKAGWVLFTTRLHEAQEYGEYSHRCRLWGSGRYEEPHKESQQQANSCYPPFPPHPDVPEQWTHYVSSGSGGYRKARDQEMPGSEMAPAAAVFPILLFRAGFKLMALGGLNSCLHSFEF